MFSKPLKVIFFMVFPIALICLLFAKGVGFLIEKFR